MSTATVDPQVDVDQDVARARTAPPVPLNPARAIELFTSWSVAATSTAQRRAARGDRFGAQLAQSRAEVYRAAARIVSDPDAAIQKISGDDQKWMDAHGWRPREHLGALLMRHAMHDAVGVETGWTLGSWDPNGIRYSRARAWQLCALHLDPTLPEAQPEWK